MSSGKWRPSCLGLNVLIMGSYAWKDSLYIEIGPCFHDCIIALQWYMECCDFMIWIFQCRKWLEMSCLLLTVCIFVYFSYQIDGLVQERRNSSALALTHRNVALCVKGIALGGDK